MTYENGIFQSGLQEKREPCVMAKMEFYELVRLIILVVRTQTHAHTHTRTRAQTSLCLLATLVYHMLYKPHSSMSRVATLSLVSDDLLPPLYNDSEAMTL